MGVAGSFFEPQPCNFGKLEFFLRCSNDISTIFWNSLWGQTCQKCQKPMCPGNSKVQGLGCSEPCLNLHKNTTTTPSNVSIKAL